MKNKKEVVECLNSILECELAETHKHSIHDILSESLHHENEQLKNLRQLLKLVEGSSVYLEEYAREMICEEELHVSEVEKMMRTQPKS